MSHFWQGLTFQQTADRFMPALRAVPAFKTPQGIRLELSEQIPQMTEFLKTNFGKVGGPRLNPILCPSPTELILAATDLSGQIVGSIRYRLAATFEGKSIHCIDCFCVKQEYRGTGLATALLLTLHELTNERNLRYSIFLKEGRPIPGQIPFYSSTYVYKATNSNPLIMKPIETDLAVRLANCYRQLHPDTVWIHSPKNPNQAWYLYKNGTQTLFVCIQDSFQEWKGGRIGWLTACFRTGSVSLDHVLSVPGFQWIWSDKVFLNGDEQDWIDDGPFHWYGYQWTSCLRPSKSYAIVL